MKQYDVTGMSCAACSARVEKAVSGVEGVSSCAVSLLTNTMGVEGSADPAAVIAAVQAAGYGASLKGEGSSRPAEDASLADTETPGLRRRLTASLGFLLVLMYVSMGHTMWGWPLPGSFEGNHVAVGLLELLLAGIVMVINQKFFISGFRGLIHRTPNMDTLVALGSGASFVWSCVQLFRMTRAVSDGDDLLAHRLMHGLWFESAAMILTLITVGKLLEARSKGRTTDALKSLMKLKPQTAVLIREGEEIEVPIAEVAKGDIFAVRPGESIPADGVVVEGSSAVNEAALTGESIPVDKQPGDSVSAATINTSGYLRCKATRVGEDTTLAQIIRTVSDAAATKAPIAKLADRVSGVFVPAVMGIALLTAVIWLLAGQSFGYALARGISVLVISCPCALGLATPVAIMVGSGVGAKNGILFKTAASLEETGRIQIVALDKTGTVTEGKPRVTDVIPAEGVSEEELILCAYSLECRSEHPLARAIVEYAGSRGMKPREVTDFRALAGSGLRAVLDGRELLGGSASFIASETGSDMLRAEAEALASQGKTPMMFAAGGKILGLVSVADTVRQDAPLAIRQLKNMGLKVVMITGDNERTARAVGKEAGVDAVIAGVLPEGKEQVIAQLREQGKTAMVGDGINDAPALTRADMGIAVGAGTDVAIDAADVVLMKSRLSDVPAAIRLSRGTLRNIKQNLFWAFCYNTVGIPLAAGAFTKLLGLELSPMFGAAAMSLSSFCVVTNALRLNFIKIHDPRRDKPLKNAAGEIKLKEIVTKEEPSMKKTMKIEGMMCKHCVAHVTKALEAVEGVKPEVSLEDKAAYLTLEKPVDDEVLKKAVVDAGYEVISIEG